MSSFEVQNLHNVKMPNVGINEKITCLQPCKLHHTNFYKASLHVGFKIKACVIGCLGSVEKWVHDTVITFKLVYRLTIKI